MADHTDTSNLAARVEQLEARLREMEDRESIRELRAEYHRQINDGRSEEMLDLFTEDAVVDFAHLGHGEGHAELRALFTIDAPPERRSGYAFIKQFIHNHVVEVDGDVGRGYAYLFATPVHAGESYVVAARYDDTYARVDGRWRFATMALVPYYMVPLREGWAQEDRIKMRR